MKRNVRPDNKHLSQKMEWDLLRMIFVLKIEKYSIRQTYKRNTALQLARWESLVEQELPTLPEHPSSISVFSDTRVSWSLAFLIVFCRLLFVVLFFLYWPLCFRLQNSYSKFLWLRNLIFLTFEYDFCAPNSQSEICVQNIQHVKCSDFPCSHVFIKTNNIGRSPTHN